jgi:hypothetical protein
MKIEFRFYTVRELCEGFEYNELEGKGLYALSGSVVVQPEFQRNFLYSAKDGKKEKAVIKTLLSGAPIGLIYLSKRPDGKMEVLDGQQRLTSIGRFIRGKFSVTDDKGNTWNINSLPPEDRERLLNTEIPVCICKGEEAEIKEWFKLINSEGIPLNNQELLNAMYFGPFVTLARAELSNSANSNANVWCRYIKGSASRQNFLEKALEWVAATKNEAIEDYMSAHRKDENIDELRNYFNSIIDWASALFGNGPKELCGLDWGRLYRTYHEKQYDSGEVKALVDQLFDDPYIHNKRGIFEYILGGCVDKQLLELRFFDEATKRIVYKKQTDAAKEKGESNCPLCALSETPNKTKIWERKEMDADHVSAWSKGGATTADNCQMLCVTHNRAKGNK